MRHFLTIFLAIILTACTKRNNESIALSANKDSTTTLLPQPENNEVYLVSTYDNTTRELESHRAGLKELYDSGAFSTIHDELFLKLEKKHQDYFNSKPGYLLLYSTPGDLFQNGKIDYAFAVYDKSNSRVSILVYDELKNSYAELFREMNVKDELETADCNYGAFGTLDYQLADELVYQRDYLIKNPKSHLEYSECKIVDIHTDEDMILDEGCFAKNFSPAKLSKSLCIPTSSVYNNWECLSYDKSKNIFVIFYGQAFAD